MEAHVALVAVGIFAAFGTGTSRTISDRLVVPLFFLAVFAFLAVLSTVFWVGGIIWETWILPRDVTAWGPDLAAAARRFRHWATYALGLLFVADIGLAVAEPVVIANGWMVSHPSLSWLGMILFESHFGLLWYIRQVIVVLALAVTLAPGKGVTAFARLLLSVVLLLTFVVPWNTGPISWEMVYTTAANLLFTVAVAAWLGGLLYVGSVLLPVMSAMRPLQRARMLVYSLPEFSRVVAAGGACVLVAGFLSSTLQFIPWTEFLTTIYGRTLAVALELLVILLAMGAYHTLFLHPRLVEALSAQDMTSMHLASDDRVNDRGHALVGAATRLYTMNTDKQSGIASEGEVRAA